MNAIDHKTPDVPPEIGSGGVRIFIHFGLPHEFSIIHSIYWPGPLLILARAIEGWLRVDRLIVEGSLGSHGVLSEGMIAFESTDRNRAIACVRQCLLSCGLLAHCVEIAWQDDAEGILRTCWPDDGPALPFLRHMDDASIDLRNELTQPKPPEP